MSGQNPPDDPTAWTFVDKSTGRKYVLKVVPSKEAAQILVWKRKRLWTLWYDYEHAKTAEEKVATRAEHDRELKQLEAVGRGLMQDALGDRMQGMPEEELWNLFATVINYCAKEGPSETE